MIPLIRPKVRILRPETLLKSQLHGEFTKTTSVIAFLLCASAVLGQQASVRRVSLLGSSKQVELEIAISQPSTPVARVVTGPDRIAFDFPNFVRGKALRNLTVRRGAVKGVRVGQFSSDPPVTRVVVDLTSPSDFEMFPSGRSVIVKFAPSGTPVAATGKTRTIRTNSNARPALVAASQAVRPRVQALVVEPKVIVGYADGKMMVKADRASLLEILNEVRRQTGAAITVPPGAEQEQVFGSFGPASPRDVLASILNGSQFNFIILGAENDPSRLQSVTLTRRGDGESQPAIYNPVVENTAATAPAEAFQPETIEPQSNQAASQQPEMPGIEPPPQSAQSEQDAPQPEQQPQ